MIAIDKYDSNGSLPPGSNRHGLVDQNFDVVCQTKVSEVLAKLAPSLIPMRIHRIHLIAATIANAGSET